jgi:hypothetical protein
LNSQSLQIEVSKTNLVDPTTEVKNFLFEYKRDILKQATRLGAKITSYKDGSVAVNMLPSKLSGQTRNGQRFLRE